MTFSIVAWDPDASRLPEWGVAVASKFLAVGAVVPWAEAGAGALATQAFANLQYGPAGLDRLRRGVPASDVVDELTAADEERAHRQLGVVDARGSAASFTGAECFDWAGHVTGSGYCCQGNILAGAEVVQRMAESFESSTGELALRLLAALAAGESAGGDRRGRQSAAMVVVREGSGYGGGTDRAVDLRVDDHLEPVGELERLFDLHRLLFPRPETLDFIAIDDVLAGELRQLLMNLGYDPGSGTGFDVALKQALFAYVGTENLEERWSDGSQVERMVLEHIRTAVRPDMPT